MGLVLFLLMGVVLLGCWALFHLLVFGDSGYLSSSPCFRGRGVDYQSMGVQNGMGGSQVGVFILSVLWGVPMVVWEG